MKTDYKKSTLYMNYYPFFSVLTVLKNLFRHVIIFNHVNFYTNILRVIFIKWHYYKI